MVVRVPCSPQGESAAAAEEGRNRKAGANSEQDRQSHRLRGFGSLYFAADRNSVIPENDIYSRGGS